MCLESKELNKAEHTVKDLFPTLDPTFQQSEGLDLAGGKMDTY